MAVFDLPSPGGFWVPANRHVILTEGIADKIACQIALEKLGIDVDQLNISIAECGSINSIKPICDVLGFLGISVFALVDEDPGNPTTAATIARLTTTIGADRVILQSPKLEGLFRIPRKPGKADALEFFPSWFEKNDPPVIYQVLKGKLN